MGDQLNIESLAFDFDVNTDIVTAIINDSVNVTLTARTFFYILAKGTDFAEVMNQTKLKQRIQNHAVAEDIAQGISDSMKGTEK